MILVALGNAVLVFLAVSGVWGEAEKKMDGREICATAGPLRVDTSDRLVALRDLMRKMNAVLGPPLDALIIPATDRHLSQVTAEGDRRLKFISGFSGDQGMAIVTANQTALWIAPYDRHLADLQIMCHWHLFILSEISPSEWLLRVTGTGSRVGVDARLLSFAEYETLERRLAKNSVFLVHTSNNLIDLIWLDRPVYPRHIAHAIPEEYSGISWQHKLSTVRMQMKREGCDALILTSLEEVAWLLNIRGRDIPYLPVIIAYVIITRDQLNLYTDPSKIGNDVRRHLHSEACYREYCARIHEYEKIFEDLRTFTQKWKRVWLPTEAQFTPGVSKAIASEILASKRFFKVSPIMMMKAQKNPSERVGMARAHVRDAAAFCEFMGHFMSKLQAGYKWDELEMAMTLDHFRRETKLSQGISFATIVAFGEHSALSHYVPTNATTINIDNSSLLLIDSGGYYTDGTTGATRTFHLGHPTKQQKERYTQTLRGLIDASALVFPVDFPASSLDSLARAPLWAVGNDYTHSTGHGVGAYLGVHEGPVIVSWDAKEREPLKEGYFFTIEPGSYIEGQEGIRLENVLEVVNVSLKDKALSSLFLKLHPITLIPFEPKLINYSMLSPQQIDWLNWYNKLIRDEVGAELKRNFMDSGFRWMLERVHHVSQSQAERPRIVLVIVAIALMFVFA